jgi:hypothetical protein
MNIDPVSGTPVAQAPQLLGSNILDLVEHGEGADFPVVRASENGKFLIAWQHSGWSLSTSDNYSNIYRSIGQKLNTGWGYFHPALPVVNVYQDWYPSIAYSGDVYTIAFRHLEGCKTYLAAVNIDGAGLTSYPTIFYNAGNLVNRVDIAYGTDVGMMVYSHRNSPSTHGIYGQFIAIPENN